MFPLDDKAALPKRPPLGVGLTPGWFNGQANEDHPVVIITRDFLIMLETELLHILEEVGIQPDKNDNKQIIAAITQLISQSLLTIDFLPLDGSKSMIGDLDLGGQKLINIGNPINDTDGVPKSYIDTDLSQEKLERVTADNQLSMRVNAVEHGKAWLGGYDTFAEGIAANPNPLNGQYFAIDVKSQEEMNGQFIGGWTATWTDAINNWWLAGFGQIYNHFVINPTAILGIMGSAAHDTLNVTLDLIGQSLMSKADKTLQINTSAGLSGGGTLSADLTLNVNIASTNQAGIVQLNDTATSNSITEAATAKQIKILNDNKVDKTIKINTSAGLSGGGSLSTDLMLTVNQANTTQMGIVQLNDTATSGSTIQAATANQIRLVNNSISNKVDKTIQINTGPNLSGGGDLSASRTINVNLASITQAGVVQLYDGANNASISMAATANQIKILNDALIALGISNASKADKTIQIIAGAGLYGGGDLTTNSTLSVLNGTTAQAGIVQLNDSLTSTNTNQALTANQGKILNDTKAPIDSPIFIGDIGIGTNIKYASLDTVGDIFSSPHKNNNLHDASERGVTKIGRKNGNTADGFAGMVLTTVNYGAGNGCNIEFYTWANAVAASRSVMQINVLGNVGMGAIASTTDKLTVNGSIKCTSIEGTTTTQAASDNSTKLASTAYVNNRMDAPIEIAPNSKTLTNMTYNGLPIYKQRFTGNYPANQGEIILISSGVNNIYFPMTGGAIKRSNATQFHNIWEVIRDATTPAVHIGPIYCNYQDGSIRMYGMTTDIAYAGQPFDIVIYWY
jgi:hypothetical protein